MWWLHRHPEGLESDLRAKIGQNGISSGVGRQDLNIPFTPGLRPRCDRILGFGRNDRGHSPSVSKTVSERSPLSQK